MRKLTIGLLFLLLSINIFAQDTIYFDKHFQKVSPNKTYHYRVYNLNQENSFIEDYKLGHICLSARLSGLVDSKSMNEFVWYIRNNQPEYDLSPYFKKLRGEFIFTADNGIVCKALFNGKDLLYYSISDASDSQILTKGSGKYSFNSAIQGEYEYLIFKDSLLVEHLAVRPDKQDTIYNNYDKMAEPYGGLQSFFNRIVKTLRYPFLKQLAGEETKIYIRFTVNKNGQLTDFEALAPNVTRFETKTIKKLSKLPDWKPAEYNGEPVKTRFVLPVTFKLE